MKFYFGKYRNQWLSPYTIIDTVMFWREIDYDEPVVKRWVKILDPVCQVLMRIRQRINPQPVYVKIDHWDVWSLDHTLALVILPSLKMLREIKHGSPMVDDEDVPVHLQSESYKNRKKKLKDRNFDTNQLHSIDDEDTTLHDGWEWVLDEMIWAFEQKLDDNAENQFFNHDNAVGMPWEANYIPSKMDKDGYDAWFKRKTNGFRLFGKYYEALWD